MKPWRSLPSMLLLLVFLIFTENVKTVYSIEDENVDGIDTIEQLENNGDENASNSQNDPTRWRTGRRHGWYYRRPPYLSRYYRQNHHRLRPYRPQARRRVYQRPRYGYRKTSRLRKPTPRPPTTKQRTVTKISSQPCREGTTVRDKCQRACACRGGKLTDCYRVRKEFKQLSKEEKRRYLYVVLIASTKEPYKTKHEALLTKHKTFFGFNIHRAAYFLPWHRWFLLQYENLLREVDCRVTVPYWDWSLVSASPFKNDFWEGTHGFGGNGVGFPPCVRTGPFRTANNWKVVKSAGGGCLQRNFVPIPGIVPDVVAVAKVLAKNLTSFSDFELMLRVNLHDVVHFAIGGTMLTRDSAAAPEFFPHHAYVDRLWTDWQAKSNLHRFHKFFLAQNVKMPGIPLTSTDLLNNENLPGCVKVKYALPGLANWEKLIEKLKVIAGKNPEQLEKLPRMPTRHLREPMFDAFGVTKEERQRAREMQGELETKVQVDARQLKGMEKMIGLKATDIQKMINKRV